MTLPPSPHSCFVSLLSLSIGTMIFLIYFVQIFAKPFIGAMDGHIDAVSCMAKNPNHLKAIFSGSMDGGNYLFLNQLLSDHVFTILSAAW
jgi:hypothetical protein